MAAYNNLPVYGAAYRLMLECCSACSSLSKAYRYSLGEELRSAVMRLLLDIYEASRTTDKFPVVRDAQSRLVEAKICLRLLNDLTALSDRRYASFMELTEDVSRQLDNWEKSLKSKGT